MLEAADKEWLVRLLGSNVRFDEPMAKHTSFRIGGPADAWVQPGSETDLKKVLRWAQQKNIPYWVIGGGTNVLVKDGGIRGLVIRLGGFAGKVTWRQKGKQVRLTAGAAVPTKHLCALSLKHGWQGMNFALGIPGTLGGAVLMNAGTAHGCMADIINSVTVMMTSGETRKIDRKLLVTEYRQLILPDNVMGEDCSSALLLGVELNLNRERRERVWNEAHKMMQGRAKRQPSWRPSAGCFFKNPSQNKPAGRLIDQAGFKGRQIGGAQVSGRHANFIVNRGNASAADVLLLADKIRNAVKSLCEIDLELEVHIVGEEKTGTQEPA